MTYVFDRGAGQHLVRLYDWRNGGWAPHNRGPVSVAGVRFDVRETPQAGANHFVVHAADAGNIVAAVLTPGDVGDRAIILQCSGLTTLSDPHLIHSAGMVIWVILRMKNRHAFEQVEKWLPQFLDLTFDEAKHIAGAADRAALSGLETRCGDLLDVVVPEEAKGILAALSILCQGYLAVWASRLKTTEDREVLSGKPVGDALDSMGWSKIDQSSLPADLPTKLDDLSKPTWWRQCFGNNNVADLANSELKGKLNESKYLKHLVAWIDEGTPVPEELGSFEDTVAVAFGELCGELRCHD